METPVIYLHFINFIISQTSIKILFVLGPDACVQYGEEGLVVGERDRRGAAERKDPGNPLDHHWCVSPETLCWNKSLQPFLNLKNLVRNDQKL